MGDVDVPRFVPVCFYDGKCEFNIGQVRIHSSLDYKAFQSLVSQRIGISPNQMSTYFVDRNNNTKPMHQRRILITGKASFNLILQGKDCTVLVVLKRSRKDRRQRSKLSNFAKSNYDFHVNNLDLLSRSMPGFFACPVLPYHDQIAAQEFVDYNDIIRNMYYCPIIQEPYIVPVPVPERCSYSYCGQCMDAKSQGKAVQFHLCVNDIAVTTWFRSPAGPIARPGGCFV